MQVAQRPVPDKPTGNLARRTMGTSLAFVTPVRGETHRAGRTRLGPADPKAHANEPTAQPRRYPEGPKKPGYKALESRYEPKLAGRGPAAPASVMKPEDAKAAEGKKAADFKAGEAKTAEEKAAATT